MITSFSINWVADRGSHFNDGHYSFGEFCNNDKNTEFYTNAASARATFDGITAAEFGGNPHSLKIQLIGLDEEEGVSKLIDERVL